MVATSSRRAKRPEGIWVWTFDLESENHAWNAGRPCPHRHSGESRNLTGTPCQRRGSGLRRNDEGAAILPMLARSEEHTSELQSLMRTSYAVFCFNKKNTKLCYFSTHSMYS